MPTKRKSVRSKAGTPAKTRESASNVRKPLLSKVVTTKTVQNGKSASALSCKELAQQISQLRETVLSTCSHPAIQSTADEVNAIRRVMADILEGRMFGVLQKLASLRQVIPMDAEELANRIDGLLEDLGAIRFTAESIEHLDPVIHEVGREVQELQFPDGVIVSTIRPGWRTARGQILARAVVSLNRRT